MQKSMTPERFKEIRNAMGLSQQKMAEALGYEHRSTVNLFESGKRPIHPRISVAMEMMAEKHCKTE